MVLTSQSKGVAGWHKLMHELMSWAERALRFQCSSTDALIATFPHSCTRLIRGAVTMPPFDVTTADRQLALQQLANVLLPLVKQDKAKAQSWAMQIESKIYESTTTKEVWQSKVYTKLKSIQQRAVGAGQRRWSCTRVLASCQHSTRPALELRGGRRLLGRNKPLTCCPPVCRRSHNRRGNQQQCHRLCLQPWLPRPCCLRCSSNRW